MKPIKQGDKWYLPITGKQAYDLRLDVPLFMESGKVIRKDPINYHDHYNNPEAAGKLDSEWWTHYKYYIEVGDPDG